MPSPLTLSRAVWRYICLMSHIHNCDVTFLSYCVYFPSFCLVSVWYHKRFEAWSFVAVEIGAIENWHYYHYYCYCYRYRYYHYYYYYYYYYYIITLGVVWPCSPTVTRFDVNDFTPNVHRKKQLNNLSLQAKAEVLSQQTSLPYNMLNYASLW